MILLLKANLNIFSYSNSTLRITFLYKDLDALAGNVAFFHADDGLPETSPLALVTASVEEIKFFKNISIKENLVLSGQVVYVGRSSMDVLVEAHQYPSSSSSSSSSDGSSSAGGIDTNKQTPLLLDDSPSSNSTRVLTSLFTYVARDKSTGKSAQVNPLCTYNHSTCMYIYIYACYCVNLSVTNLTLLQYCLIFSTIHNLTHTATQTRSH